MQSLKTIRLRGTALVGASLFAFSSNALAVTQSEVIENLSDIAQMMYEDSVVTATALKEANLRLIAKPTEQNLSNARAMWRLSLIHI